MKKIIDHIKSFVYLYCILMAGFIWFTATNATQADVDKVQRFAELNAQRLEQKIVYDEVINLMDKIDRYEVKHQCIDTLGCRIQMDSAQFELYETWLDRLFCLENPHHIKCISFK